MCSSDLDTVVYEGPAHDPDPQPMPFRMAEGLGDDRERGVFAPEMGRAMGFDATRKEPGEVAGGGTPEELEMSPDVQDLVTRRWGDYGLSPNSRPGW